MELEIWQIVLFVIVVYMIGFAMGDKFWNNP